MSTFAVKSYDEGSPYTVALDNSGGSDSKQTIYRGEADPGVSKSVAKWRIAKYTLDGNDNITDIQWADGNRNFDNIWDNRATYTYS